MPHTEKGIENTPEIQRLRTKLCTELLWIYILALLKEKPSHAYALRKAVHRRFSFMPGNVSAYVVLYKLKSRGYVESHREKGRKVYRLAKKGQKLLEAARKIMGENYKALFGS